MHLKPISKSGCTGILKLLTIPLAFLAAGTAAIRINISKMPLDAFAFSVGEWYITGSRSGLYQGWKLGEWYITGSRNGLYQGWKLCATALAAVTCLYFLSLNTVMTDILGACRKLRLPSLLIELMLLIYRFIFVLFETASSIMISQQSRLGNRDFKTRVRSFGALGTSLFILSLKRSNALYDAMESRCYDGRIQVLSREQPVRVGEVVMIVLYEAVLIAVWFCL